eukprot:TRINITY_DN1713_c1_g1_i1.p1 TRINITY_DN1713_c1_g1~~TRINITY_DN1713_c1_g1_i1.p1  ORF type:complete len:455 (-),score=94.02 TRINITY_DN1713_c1_g1_i1:922-2109(-)
MEAGQVIFSDPNKTPLKFPEGEYGITEFMAEIVDENGDSTPLSEVYLHHWLIFNTEINAGFCGTQGSGAYLTYIFGVGAESRRTPTQFPAPYAYPVHDGQRWAANIHVLRTGTPEGVPFVQDVKSCIECHCPGGGGGFSCCPDGSFCPTLPNAPGPKTYFLTYTITMVPKDEFVPIDIYVLDASNCEIEYDISQCTSPDPSKLPCDSSRNADFPMPQDAEIVYILPHQHIGAYNITLSLDQKALCTGSPIYGNGTAAGNEKGYVVEMTRCTPDTPIPVKKGQVLNGNGLYDSQPYHDAVMSLIYIAMAAPKSLEAHQAYLVRRAGLQGRRSGDIALGAALGAVGVVVAALALMYWRSRHQRQQLTADSVELETAVDVTLLSPSSPQQDGADDELE